MIEFFRDVLDGPLYIVVTIISIIFIMAIIGFMMERKKLEKEAKSKVAVVDTSVVNNSVTSNQNVTPATVNSQNVVEQPAVTPINPIPVQPEVAPVSMGPTPISDIAQNEENSSVEVKTPVIVFEDPDQKKE